MKYHRRGAMRFLSVKIGRFGFSFSWWRKRQRKPFTGGPNHAF